jgi:hypothetical protein
MELGPFVVGVVALTSVGAYLIALALLGRPPSGLRAAVGRMLECLGAALVFMIVNLAVGAAIVLGTRATTGGFISIYLLDDATWVVLSALQGLAWSLWRQAGERARPGGEAR